MDSSKIEKISKELDKLELVGGILGTAVVNRNGLTIFAKLPRQIDERKFGAMAATMFGAIETAIMTLGSKLLNLTVEFDELQLVILADNNDLIIVALIELNVDLGLIFVEIEESINKIKNL